MKKVTLGILAAAAVVTAGLAAVAILGQPRVETTDASGAALFPNLVREMDKLKSVVIRHGDSTITLDWDGKAWHYRERGNYPADGDKVTAMVVRIARMSKLENKTRMPDRYDRLDLGDPAAKGTSAKQVTLDDAGGKALATLIVGKRKFTLGDSEGGTYVRLPGDPQTWLVRGDVTVGDASHDWLKRDITDIKETAIKRVTVTRPNGDKIIASKPDPAARSFAIENMPKGTQPMSEFVADDYGRLLANLQLDDVAPADSVAFAKGQTTEAVIEGRDGFQVVLDLFEDKEKLWLKVKGMPPAAGAAPASSDSADKTDWTKAMADLDARTQGWAFEVPNYAVAILTRNMSDLVKKPDAKAAAGQKLPVEFAP